MPACARYGGGVEAIYDWGLTVIAWLQRASPALDTFFELLTWFGDERFLLFLVPFVYWSVNVWRTLHPKTTVVPSLGPGMREAFWWCTVAFLTLYLALLAARTRLERERAALDGLYLELDE